MKSILLKVGLLTTLSVGLVTGKASAAEMDWATKCSSMGDIKQGENPSYQQINCLLTNAALSKNIPPEVVKAVAEQESAWKQFNNGQVVSDGKGFGIMQVTDSVPDPERVKSDIVYNIEQGLNILNAKYELQNSSTIPRIKGAGREIIENWYFPVMAYNGLKPVNSPIFRGGGRNWTTYQDKVFNKIEVHSFLGKDQAHNILAQYLFEEDDFIYDSKSSANIEFENPMPEYVITNGLHKTIYTLKKDDIVRVTKDGATLRSQPTTSASGTAQPLNKTFIINGDFQYTQPNTSLNHFVWFPVKSSDGKSSGFIASAYISKLPTVTGVKNNAYYNKDIKITFDEGTALLNGASFNSGSTVTKPGKYTLVVKDEESNTTTITFIIDKTIPVKPYMNDVSDLSTTVTGKAEAGSTVKLSINGKYQKSTTAASNGSFKFSIYKQKSGTTVSVTSTDKAGNVSPTRTKTVLDKTAPAKPIINTVTTKSKTVSGSAEKYATVRIYRGSTLLGKGTVYSTGKFSVAIPVQKVKTYLKVTVTDKAGNVSYNTIQVK